MSRTHVPLDRIEDNPYQSRLDVGDLEPLAETILSVGLQSIPPARLVDENGEMARDDGMPITIAAQVHLKENEEWAVQLGAGHRRTETVRLIMEIYEAGGVLGGEQVTEKRLQRASLRPGKMPVEVKALTDDDMLDVLTVENAQREDLSAIEEARLISEMVEAGRTTQKIADRFGKSPSWVSNRKRLLDLPQYVQDLVHDGKLSARKGHALVKAFALEQEHPEAMEEIRRSDLQPGNIVKDARRGRLNSTGVRSRVSELGEAIEKVEAVQQADSEDELEEAKEEMETDVLPSSWEWVEASRDNFYRAVRKLEDATCESPVILEVERPHAGHVTEEAMKVNAKHLEDEVAGLEELPPDWSWYGVWTPHRTIDWRARSANTELEDSEHEQLRERAWKRHHDDATDYGVQEPHAETQAEIDESMQRAAEKGEEIPDDVRERMDRDREQAEKWNGEAKEMAVEGFLVDVVHTLEDLGGPHESFGWTITRNPTGDYDAYVRRVYGSDTTHEWAAEGLQEMTEALGEAAGKAVAFVEEDQDSPVGHVDRDHVSRLLNAGEDMWDEEAASDASIASLYVAYVVANRRQERWRREELAQEMRRRDERVTEDDFPDDVWQETQNEIDRRLEPQAA